MAASGAGPGADRKIADVVTLDGGTVSPASVLAVARGHATVFISHDVRARLDAARLVVERWAETGRGAYGVTTGLGAAVDTTLRPDELAEFQRRAVMARAVGVGPVVPVAEVRAMIFVRLAGLARGASGISPALADTLCSVLNRGVHPLVRRTGSLGAADLAPLAEAMLPLVGAGEAEFEDVVLPGPEALRRAGIETPRLGPKDAIALLNSNAFGIGLSCLALDEAEIALGALTAAGALSLEAFRANLSVIDPRIVALRPEPGQTRVSEHLRALLRGSSLFDADEPRRVQDPLSIRCLAPVHGAVDGAAATLRSLLEIELGGAGDSPAVLMDADEILSTVNFDTTALALALESLGRALAAAATLAAWRIVKLMSNASSGLPRFLSRRGGSRSGFATAQKSAAALETAVRHLSLPLGPPAVAVADGVEDYAAMLPAVAEKTRAVAAHVLRLAAIELAVSAEGCDLREGIRLGVGTAAAHAFIRQLVEPLDDDRPMGGEFERVSDAIGRGELRDALAGAGCAS